MLRLRRTIFGEVVVRMFKNRIVSENLILARVFAIYWNKSVF